MDDPNEENIESNWVIINNIDIAEEATVLDSGKYLDENEASTKNDGIESDMESDGISIISESSHLHDGSNEEENISSNEEVNHDTEKLGDTKDGTTSETTPVVKTNWTYVHSEISSPKMAASNQFYLNCLQEPIQELSEHELGSIQSDLESDGISIISDCESLNEFAEDVVKKLVEDVVLKDECENVEAVLASKFHSGIKKYCNGVLIGTILLATSSIFVGQYFNSVEQSEEDLPIYKEEFGTDLEEQVPEKIKDFKDKYEVPSALAYCQERNKVNGIFVEHNVKKCLDKIEKRMKRKKDRVLKEEEINKLNKYLKIKEQYLDEKEKFLIKKEYELLKAEMKLKGKHLRKNKKYKKGDENKLDKNEDSPTNTVEREDGLVRNEIKIGPDMTVNKGKKYKEIKHEDPRSTYEMFKKKRREHQEKHFKEHKDEYKKEPFKNHNFRKSDKHYIKTKETEKDLKDNKHKDKENSQFDNSREKRHDKPRDKKNKGPTNYIILENKNGNETLDGYWLGRLYKGRSHLRNKQHSGDWYFDRASYRKTRRDKAKWYFDWMMDRELLRHRRSFYM